MAQVKKANKKNEILPVGSIAIFLEYEEVKIMAYNKARKVYAFKDSSGDIDVGFAGDFVPTKFGRLGGMKVIITEEEASEIKRMTSKKHIDSIR